MHTHVATMAFMQEGKDPTWGEDGVTRVLAHVGQFGIRSPEEFKGWVGYEVERDDLAQVVTYARDEWLQALAAQTLLLFDDVTVRELEAIIVYMDEPQPFSLRRIPWRPRRAFRYLRRHLRLLPVDFFEIRKQAMARLVTDPDIDVPKDVMEHIARSAPKPFCDRAKDLLVSRYM